MVYAGDSDTKRKMPGQETDRFKQKCPVRTDRAVLKRTNYYYLKL
jgi:hypothetical protein